MKVETHLAFADERRSIRQGHHEDVHHDKQSTHGVQPILGVGGEPAEELHVVLKGGTQPEGAVGDTQLPNNDAPAKPPRSASEWEIDSIP